MKGEATDATGTVQTFYPDPEIFDWISGRAAVPGDVESPVTKLLLKFDISAQNIDRY